MPPRPAGQRAEPEQQQHVFQGFGYGDGGFHMSFGIGAFPFGFFTSSFNFGDVRPPCKCLDTELNRNKPITFHVFNFRVLF